MTAFEYELESLAKVLVAMVLCGALGWERASTGKSAGLRTHMLVGIGAALFVILAHVLVREFETYGEALRFDSVRVLQAVATGVSFLGAGTIVFARGSDRVRGLTTAASLWTTAGVGMAVAMGQYILACGATLLVLLILRLLLALERRIDGAGEPRAVADVKRKNL